MAGVRRTAETEGLTDQPVSTGSQLQRRHHQQMLQLMRSMCAPFSADNLPRPSMAANKEAPLVLERLVRERPMLC